MSERCDSSSSSVVQQSPLDHLPPPLSVCVRFHLYYGATRAPCGGSRGRGRVSRERERERCNLYMCMLLNPLRVAGCRVGAHAPVCVCVCVFCCCAGMLDVDMRCHSKVTEEYHPAAANDIEASSTHASPLSLSLHQDPVENIYWPTGVSPALGKYKVIREIGGDRGGSGVGKPL